MGSVGHHCLMYEMRNWQIRAALRGYYRSQRVYWETARFISMIYSNINRDPRKPPLNINDIISFPWEENEFTNTPTEEEIEELRRQLAEENKMKLPKL